MVGRAHPAGYQLSKVLDMEMLRASKKGPSLLRGASLAINGITWKWEIIVGIMAMLAGLFLWYVSDMWRARGLVLIGVIFVPLQVIALLLMTSGILERKIGG